MSESVPAQHSAQPSESSQPQHDERNDEIAGDETASLLPPEDNPPPAGLSSPKAIYVLTSMALSFSVSTLVLLIATQIALAAGPNDYNLGWRIRESMRAVITPAIFSLLMSAFNLARLRRGLAMAPPLINIILDVLVAIFAIVYGASGLAGTGEGYCYSYPRFDNSCMRRALPAQILAGIALGSAVVFGTVHLALFVVRCIVAFRSKFWKGPWRFPDGQLTVELSLKLFKEPQKPREVGAEAV